MNISRRLSSIRYKILYKKVDNCKDFECSQQIQHMPDDHALYACIEMIYYFLQIPMQQPLSLSSLSIYGWLKKNLNICVLLYTWKLGSWELSFSCTILLFCLLTCSLCPETDRAEISLMTQSQPFPCLSCKYTPLSSYIKILQGKIYFLLSLLSSDVLRWLRKMTINLLSRIEMSSDHPIVSTSFEIFYLIKPLLL